MLISKLHHYVVFHLIIFTAYFTLLDSEQNLALNIIITIEHSLCIIFSCYFAVVNILSRHN